MRQHDRYGTDRVLRVDVGGLTRDELRARLRSRGVMLNAYAERLLHHPVFKLRERDEIDVIERSVGELGLSTGALLLEVFAAASKQGLALCPPDTGPYLRFVMASQENAPDSILSAGRSPKGAVKVASAPLSNDAAFPRASISASSTASNGYGDSAATTSTCSLQRIDSRSASRSQQPHPMSCISRPHQNEGLCTLEDPYACVGVVGATTDVQRQRARG